MEINKNIKYNYSVIIPHKNIPELLTRCLASIPKRGDVQIIVVDDNSDEGVVDFEKFPGLNEPCVEVYFSKEGKGAGYARNIGLSHAQGKWLLFVDADDFLVDDALKKMDEFIDSDNDIVFFHLVNDLNASYIPSNLRDIIDIKRANNYNAILHGDRNKLPLEHNIPVGKMVKRLCVEKNNLLFDEVPCANDIMFFTKLAFCVRKIEVSNEYLYCVSSPISHNLTSRKDFNSGKIRLEVALNRNKLLQEHGLNKMVTPPLTIIWQFRHLGLRSIVRYCWLTMKSSTPIFTGMSKFLRKPISYIRHCSN